MQNKSISFSIKKGLFSIENSNGLSVTKAVPAYKVPRKIMKLYEANDWRNIANNVSIYRELYKESEAISNPYTFFMEHESIGFIFKNYGSNKCADYVTFGFSSFDLHEINNESCIYVAEIENYKKNDYQGIGRAAVALAIHYYFMIYPYNLDEKTAIKIMASDENVKERYLNYGFDEETEASLDLLMTVTKARLFMEQYQEYWKR